MTNPQPTSPVVHLNESREFLAQIINATSTCVFWKDTRRRFLGVNQAFLNYYGFPSANMLIGKTDEDMGWHSDPDPFKNDEEEVLRGNSTYRVHGTCIARGVERDILATKSPIYENGKIVGLVGTFEDVSEEYRWQRENARFTSILENVPGGIAIFRKEGRAILCIYANRFFLNMLGFIDEYMVVGRPYQEIARMLHPEDGPRLQRQLDLLQQQNDQSEHTYRFRKVGDPNYRWYHLVFRKVPQPHKDMLYYATFTDVDAAKKSSEELVKTQALYERVIVDSELLLYEYDLLTRTLRLEPTSSNLHLAAKYQLEQVILNAPESTLDKINPSSRPAYLEMYRQVNEGRSASCEVWTVATPNQEPRCDRISYTVLKNEDGLPTKAFAVVENVTTEKIKEEKYNTFINYRKGLVSNSLASYHLNLTTNWCGDGHAQVPELLTLQEAKTSDGFFARVRQNITRSEEQEQWVHEFNRAALLDSFTRGKTSLCFEHRYRFPSGQERWMRVYLDMAENPFTREIEAVTYSFDINDEKYQEMIINELVGTDFDFVCLLNLTTGKVTEFGAHGENYARNGRLVEADYTASMTAAVQALVREDNVPEALEAHSIAAIKDHLQKEEIYHLSFPTRDHHMKGWRISYLDQEHNLVLIGRSDITETVKKEMERLKLLDQARMRAENANEAKSVFLSNISHDLRTPLNGVIGFTELAMKEKDPAVKQDYLEKIKTSGDLLLALVNDTLDISRIESGKMTLQLEETDSREIGEHVISALHPAAELKQIKLIADFESFPKKSIWVDKLKVQKIILNLVSNAIKYTPMGGTVWVNIQDLNPPVRGCNRRILVKDTGIGMSREFLPRIFEPFAQEHRKESQNVTGTGLGMSIVKRIVDLMGGRITVNSQLHHGTTFVVDLPVSKVSEGRRVKREQDEEQISLIGKKVLVCEDNYLNREIARNLLKSKGILVDCAEDGQLGLEAFKRSAPGEYAAILMDIRMPQMNGYEATQAIRRLDRPDAATIPILAMTADAFEEDIRQAREIGMNGYLTKPVNPARMYALLAEKIK